MARATTSRQLANAAARQARNSTAGAAGVAAPPANPPRPATPDQPLVNEAIDTSIEALNRRLIQDQIDHNAAIARQNIALAEQTLQFAAAAEERRINQETLESQARLAPTPNQSLPAVDLSSESLIQSLAFIDFSSKFPAIPEKQLVRVFKWPNRDYEACEIYKLLISNIFDAKDDRYEGTLVGGTVTYLRKRGDRRDYPSIATWSPAFLQYSLIRLVANQNIELHLKQQNFHAKIVRLERIYAWDGVLGLALYLHQSYINDPAASWAIPTEETDARCVKKSIGTSSPSTNRTSSPRRVSQAAATSICRQYNSGKCESPCSWGRLHQCDREGCTGAHMSSSFHKDK